MPKACLVSGDGRGAFGMLLFLSGASRFAAGAGRPGAVGHVLGAGWLCPTSRSVVRKASAYSAASTRVLCGKYNPECRGGTARKGNHASLHNGMPSSRTGHIQAALSQPLFRLPAFPQTIIPVLGREFRSDAFRCQQR